MHISVYLFFTNRSIYLKAFVNWSPKLPTQVCNSDFAEFQLACQVTVTEMHPNVEPSLKVETIITHNISLTKIILETTIFFIAKDVQSLHMNFFKN